MLYKLIHLMLISLALLLWIPTTIEPQYPFTFGVDVGSNIQSVTVTTAHDVHTVITPPTPTQHFILYTVTTDDENTITALTAFANYIDLYMCIRHATTFFRTQDQMELIVVQDQADEQHILYHDTTDEYLIEFSCRQVVGLIRGVYTVTKLE